MSPRTWPLQWLAAAVAALGAAAAVVGVLVWPAQFYGGYLTAYTYWMSLTLGCLALALLFWLAGGLWGLATERFFEAGAATLPAMILLFIPVALGMPTLYPWTNLQAVAANPLLLHKQPYLNVPFFLARTAFYFVVWLILLAGLLRWSRQRDQAPEAATAGQIARRLQHWGAAGLALLGLTCTFAAIDWVMSLQPLWYSTVFGSLLAMGGVLGAFGLGTALAALGARREPLRTVVTPRVLNDLGSLMLALVMLWAYLEFSQYLVVWYGDLPAEVVWYLQRIAGNWRLLVLAIIVTQFALPLCLLIVREVKRSAPLLAGIALLILVTRYLDFYWLVKPALSQGFHWLDPALALGMGGLWFTLFIWRWRRAPPLPRPWPVREAPSEASRAVA
jgi:hypothetical protein